MTRKGEIGLDVREMGQLSDDIRVPNSTGIVLVDDVFEVEFQSFLIAGRVGHSLGDFDDDGTEAGGVEVDFLVVGNFADVAVKGEMVSAALRGLFEQKGSLIQCEDLLVQQRTSEQESLWLLKEENMECDAVYLIVEHPTPFMDNSCLHRDF